MRLGSHPLAMRSLSSGHAVRGPGGIARPGMTNKSAKFRMASDHTTATRPQTVRSPVGTDAERVISVRNVAHRFSAGDAARNVLALDNISLDVRRGEFLTLLGPSGCGKSTLLNIIGGLIQPTEGAVSVDGIDVKGPLPDKIAFVFQESTLFPWYTVAENFGIAFKYRGVARSEWRDRASAALKSVGMESFIDHYPNQLSIGMRQRVNLARGIASGTEILLMDEPFAALDEQTRMVL